MNQIDPSDDLCHDTREFEHPRDGEPAHDPSIDGPSDDSIVDRWGVKYHGFRRLHRE